jgi:hypothetical protein
MQIIVFSKKLASQSVPELIETAHKFGFDGYDLCIRPGHPVNPDNDVVGESPHPPTPSPTQGGGKGSQPCFLLPSSWGKD